MLLSGSLFTPAPSQIPVQPNYSTEATHKQHSCSCNKKQEQISPKSLSAMLSASSSRLFQPQHRHTLNYKHPSHTGCLRSCTPHALHHNSRGKNAASSAVVPHATSPAGAVILEADGTLTDLHMDGHRVAFNKWVLPVCAGTTALATETQHALHPLKRGCSRICAAAACMPLVSVSNSAFRDLGFECAHWTPAIYHDLLSKGVFVGEQRAAGRADRWAFSSLPALPPMLTQLVV